MQQDSDYRLEFDVVTPRYLGNPDVAKICVEEVGRLPRKLWPTKTEDSTFKKSRFSFHDPRAFELAVPGTAPFDGYARLYKVRDVFSFHLFWSKGSEEWYRENPGQKFNRAGMSVRDGQAAVGQSRSFARIQSVWLLSWYASTRRMDSCTCVTRRLEGPPLEAKGAACLVYTGKRTSMLPTCELSTWREFRIPRTFKCEAS